MISLPLLSYTVGLIMLSYGAYRYAYTRSTQKLSSVAKVPSNKVASSSFASAVYNVLQHVTKIYPSSPASKKPSMRDR